MSTYNPNKLYRIKEQGVICGICAGLADFFGFSVILVRIAAVLLLVFFTPVTFVVYILLRLLLSNKPQDSYRSPREEKLWQDVRRSPKNTVSDLKAKFFQMDKRLQRMEAKVTSKEYRFNQEL